MARRLLTSGAPCPDSTTGALTCASVLRLTVSDSCQITPTNADQPCPTAGLGWLVLCSLTPHDLHRPPYDRGCKMGVTGSSPARSTSVKPLENGGFLLPRYETETPGSGRCLRPGYSCLRVPKDRASPRPDRGRHPGSVRRSACSLTTSAHVRRSACCSTFRPGSRSASPCSRPDPWSTHPPTRLDRACAG
jgi:hypothetical protein